MTVSRLLAALTSGDWPAAQAAMEEVEAAGLWSPAMLAVRSIEKPVPAVCDGFHTLWTVRGHRIREQLADDALLFDVLRVLLPTYDGPDLMLYRGESLARHATRAYGAAWTNREDIALMFARGLNAWSDGGGVLLSTFAPASAIIAGPSSHSVYLGEYEYVVDREKLAEVSILERFDPA